MHELHAIQVEPIIRRALEEDWGYGDWTTDLCVDRERQAKARIICKEDCLIAGVDIAAAVFRTVDPQLQLNIVAANGFAA